MKTKKSHYKDPPRFDLILQYEGVFKERYRNMMKQLMKSAARKLKKVDEDNF